MPSGEMRRLAVEQTAGSHSLAAAAHRERSADDARGRPFTVHFPVAAFPIGRKIRMLEGTIRRWPHAGSHGQHVLPWGMRRGELQWSKCTTCGGKGVVSSTVIVA